MKTMGKRAWLSSLAVVAAAFAALAPAAAAETITATQNTDVVIPTTAGKANTYPSAVTVQGGDGTITDINVNLNLSHTFPDDLDIALVSPSGDAEILMADVCGETDIVNASITLDSEAGPNVSDAGSCVGGGTFQPTNIGAGDTWDAPGPTVTTTQLASFNNETPNGSWQLFVMDDVGGDGGTVNSWTLTIVTNTAELVVPDTGSAGKARPYPSTKAFNTPAGQVISDLNLGFTGFTHTFPDDVDALLVGPRRGANVLAMSDACGSTDVPGPTIDSPGFLWTFDDEATKSMTDEPGAGLFGDCIFVNLKPSAFETPDAFPSPAPGAPYGSTMSAFDGLEGGIFNLFVDDDAGSDTGFITSWTVNLTTRDAADTGFAVSTLRVEEGGKAVLEVKRAGVAAANLGPATLNLLLSGTATAGTDYTAPSGTLEFARGEASKKIEIPIADDKVGEATEKFKVTISSPQDDARLKGNASTEVTIGPDNEFKFGKLKKNAKKGTAKLFVKVPGPGLLVLTGEQVKKVKKTVKKAGNVGLAVKPKGNAVNLLEEAGSAKLRARVAFTPTDGSLFSKTKKLKLVLGN